MKADASSRWPPLGTTMLLPLVLAAVERRASRRVTAAVALVAVASGVTVATGRVVAGAHYASDVLFPSGVAWACVLLLLRSRAASKSSLG